MISTTKPASFQRSLTNQFLGRWGLIGALLWSTGCMQHTRAQTDLQTEPQTDLVTRITTITTDGGRLDWNEKRGLLVIDHLEKDDFFDIYLMKPDGSERECLTCDHPDLPDKHIGNPAWHPSGKYIAMQVQNTHKGIWKITNWFANPGAGINNDVFLMNVETKEVTRVTEVPPQEGGVLHPHFSKAGDKIFWSERVSSTGATMGLWVLRVGDVSIRDGKISVSNIRTHTPGAQQAFYESHCFDDTGRCIIFSGNLEKGQGEHVGDIFRYDLTTKKLENLTRTMDHWDEHGQMSPSGKSILWMSSMGVKAPKNGANVKTDYWIMNADGTGKKRLTYFNQEGHPHYIEGGATAADSAWSADGTKIYAYVIDDIRKRRTRNIIIELAEPR